MKNRRKHIDKERGKKYNNKADIARLCKGSTTDSDSVCLGSNPSPAARKKTFFDKEKCLFSAKFADAS